MSAFTSFASYDGKSWRSLQASLFAEEAYVGAWPRAGTLRSGIVAARAPSAVWRRALGPTPTGARFPTPRAEDAECSGGHRGTDDTLYGKICKPKDGSIDAPGQLNPTWVEWLMGFPMGWTA